MAKKTISLLELRKLTRRLDSMIHDAWMNTGTPAEISYQDIRDIAAAISAMVAEDGPSAKQSPHASEGNKPPAAADTDKADAQKRADYQRAAADAAPAGLSAILGLSHIRRS